MIKFLVTMVLLLLTGCRSSNNIQTITPTPLQDVNFQVGFSIFIKGAGYNLNKPIYLNQDAKAYLDSKYPNIVQVKKAPLTWQDFLDSTPLRLTDTCLTLESRSTYCSEGDNEVKVFLNGVRIVDLNSHSLNHADQVLITFGNETGVEIERQLNQVPKIK